MKSTIRKKTSCFLLSGALGLSTLAGAFPVTVFAEEPAAETEEISTEAAAAEQEFTVEMADGQTAEIVNKTGDPVSEVSYDEDGDTKTLVVTEEDGTVHTFEDADLSEASGCSILKKLSYFFVCGTGSDGAEKWFYETAGDVSLDEPVTMYTTGMVNIREEADGDSALLGTADLGSEVEVLGGTPKWFLVNQGEVSGYAAARYLTDDEDEADAAVSAEAAAQAAAEAAAAEAAAAASSDSYDYSYDSGYSDSYDYSYDSGYSDSYDYSYSSGGSSSSDSASSAPTETGREAVYDCDGSGGGYYIITYSDGSESYEDF